MSILTLGSKKEEKENFQSKKKRRKFSNQRKKGSKEIPNQRVGESEKKRKKIPNQRMGENKKRRRKRKEESSWSKKQKKCAERSFDQTKSEQYRIVTKWTKGRKGNHDLKWSSPFDYQPKSCASVTCSPRVKQEQKRKKPKKIKSRKTHQKNPFPREVLLIHDHTCNLWFDRT